MTRHSILLAGTAILFCGCASFRYSEFTGHQYWPTASGTMADTALAVPVYRGWPDKPYTVIGSIQFANPNAAWDDGDTARAAHLAKSKQGDALVMRVGSEAGVGAIAGAAADPKVFSIGQVAALVIKWKPEAEIAAEAGALRRFASDFKTKHPELTLTSSILDLGVETMHSQGLTLGSAAADQQLDALLTEVLQPPADGKGSKWLYKGSLRSSALTSAYTQMTYGVATVTQNGDNVTIVVAPAPGQAGVHFTGTVKDGRLAGQLGVTIADSIYSGKAEGVFSPEQISVSGQAQTTDGLLQANFQFLR